MRVHEQRVLKIPVDELRQLLRKSHGVDLGSVEPYLDGEYVVFSLDVGAEKVAPLGIRPKSDVVEGPHRVRRRKKKRNRVRTRGWRVVSKITNSQGLTANIYEPFVSALGAKPLPKSEQRKLVRQIMVDNGNKPTDESVEYFLTNTLEYLSTKK